MHDTLTPSPLAAIGFGPGVCERNAIMVPGPAIAEARGKAGGLIFSRNRGGMYFKSFAAPINPQSTLQQANRVIFGSIVGHWNDSLTQPQRTGWNDFAQANPVPNKLGQDILLSGQNWYMRFNQDRLLANLARDDDAPLDKSGPPTDPTVSISDADASGQDMSLNFDVTQPWNTDALSALVLFLGKPQGPGVASFQGPWRLQMVLPGIDPAGNLSPTGSMPSPWNFVIGQNLFGKAVIVRPGKMPTMAFRYGPIVAG